MMMNIKTFMAIAVVALTAACSEAPAVTTDEAVNAVAADDNVEAAPPDAEAANPVDADNVEAVPEDVETPLASPII